MVLNVVAVVIQFLSGIVSLADMARFSPFLLQSFALYPSALLDSGHSLLNQFYLSPLPFLPSLLQSLFSFATPSRSRAVVSNFFAL